MTSAIRQWYFGKQSKLIERSPSNNNSRISNTPHQVIDVNRRQTDLLAGFLTVAILVTESALSWQTYEQQSNADQMRGMMMDTSMGSVHGTNPVTYVLGTFVISAVIGGLYLAVRDTLPVADDNDQHPEETWRSAGRDPAGRTGHELRPNGAIDSELHPRNRILDFLPEDERRVLEPVLASPGITQIDERDRSEFSKSKVSQTVNALEIRGLLYRERQVRTYRIYPSDELAQNLT